MAGPSVKKVDDPTIQALVVAFNHAVEELQTAEKTVLNCSGDLGAVWLGNASMRYQQGLQEISHGLVTIRSGLNDITDDMLRFAALTTNTEDDNLVHAAGVTLGNDTFTPPSSWT
jgi:uncharacterized protein YukE